MIEDSESIEDRLIDPFEKDCDPQYELLCEHRFSRMNWHAVLSHRYPRSVISSLNKEGTVYEVTLESGALLVVKYVPLTNIGKSEAFFTHLFSGNIGPELYEAFPFDPCIELVMEKADATLSQLPIRDADHLLTIARDLAFLCLELEQRGLGHYDLKGGNVLCYLQDGEEEVLRLADFGFTMPIRRFEELYFGRVDVGTPGYIPPEAFCRDADQLALFRSSSERSLCSRADVFAYGVLLAKLADRNTPAYRHSAGERDRMVSGAYRDEILQVSSALPNNVLEIIYSCTERDPRARPQSFGEILGVLES